MAEEEEYRFPRDTIERRDSYYSDDSRPRMSETPLQLDSKPDTFDVMSPMMPWENLPSPVVVEEANVSPTYEDCNNNQYAVDIPMVRQSVVAHSARPSGLEQLPDDSLFSVLRFLRAEDVDRLGQTCKHFRDQTRQPTVWQPLYTQVFGEPAVASADPRRSYLRRVADWRQFTARQAMRFVRTVLIDAAQRRAVKLRTCFDVFQNLVTYTLPITAVLIFTIFLYVHLTTENSTWTALEISSPLWVYMFLLCVLILVGMVRRCFKAVPSTSMCFNFNESRHGCFALFSEHYDRFGLPLIMALTLLVVFILLTPVLILLRVHEVITVSYGVVTIPFWLVFITVCALAPLGCSWRPLEVTGIYIVLIALFVMLFPVIVMALLRLDGMHLPFKYMFIPLWIVDCIIAIGFVGSLGALAFNIHGDIRALAVVIGMLVFGGAALSGFFAFEIILALMDDGWTNFTYTDVFAPLWVALCVVQLFGLLISALAFHDNDSYRNASNWPHEPLYPHHQQRVRRYS